MSQNEIARLEKEINTLTEQLAALRADSKGYEVSDYTFKTADGEVTLRQLFGKNKQLLAIHNMGQGCRYCTLWADGINGFLPHLESAMSVVLLSKDDPEIQRKFANSRGWRYRMASHGAGKYMQDQVSSGDGRNMPGAALYEMRDGKIYLKNRVMFGPGDQFCSLWNFLSLAGIGEEQWVPQYNYWQRPEKLEDGGQNVVG